MPLDVNDQRVRELFGRIVLGGARLEANVAGMLARLQTPRLTSTDPARRANARLSLARMIDQCRLCVLIRGDDGILEPAVAERLRGILDKADNARRLRNRYVHSNTVIIEEVDEDTQGAIDFIGDHAVTATVEDLDSAGMIIDDAGSEAYLGRKVAEYQMGLRRWG